MILIVERLFRGKWQQEWEGEDWTQQVRDLTNNFDEHGEQWRVFVKGEQP